MVASFISSQIEGEAPRPARHHHVLSGLFVIDAHDSNVVKRVPARLELGSVAKAQLLALTRMSAYGYKQTSSRPKLRSALPPKADIRVSIQKKSPATRPGLNGLTPYRTVVDESRQVPRSERRSSRGTSSIKNMER